MLPLLRRGWQELITGASFASSDPLEGGGGGVLGWKAEAGCRGIRMWRAARVLVAGARATSFQPCSGLRCGLRLSAGARQLPGRGGLGAAGRQGAEGLGQIGASRGSRPLSVPLVWAGLPGSRCKGRVGSWIAFGVRAGFLLSGAPCLPSSLPFWLRFRPRPAPF